MAIKDPPNGVLPFRENNPPPKKDLRRAAEKWIDENPEGYALYVRFALQAASKGRRFGINALTERVRWEAMMEWNPDERGFKINNNHAPYIARKLIEDYPQLEPLIECRKTFW